MLARDGSGINHQPEPFQVARHVPCDRKPGLEINHWLEVFQWIQWSSVDADLKQQVGTGAESCAADLPDRFAVLHELTDPDGDDGQMRIPGRDPISMIDYHQPAVPGFVPRHGHPAGPGGKHGAARGSADVDARVHFPCTEDGVLAKSKTRGHAATRRPEKPPGDADR